MNCCQLVWFSYPNRLTYLWQLTLLNSFVRGVYREIVSRSVDLTNVLVITCLVSATTNENPSICSLHLLTIIFFVFIIFVSFNSQSRPDF